MSTGKAAARKLTPARLLLLADPPGENGSDADRVGALSTSLRTVARVRQSFVTQSLRAAMDRKAQPPRPDKLKIKGPLEQQLVKRAGSDPPRGRCHWTLPMLADAMVVLGLVNAVSTVSVRPALKKTTLRLGAAKRGASRPRPTPSTSGGWKT